MYQTQVLKSAALQGLIDQILRLDRINMAPILRASGMEFPESRRLEVLKDPELTVVAARAGNRLAAYVEFAPDGKPPGGIYISSLQVDARYRRGIALASVLSRMGELLKDRPPSQLRLDVQRTNTVAQSLFARLGFVVQEADPEASTLRAIASPEILEAGILQRLSRRYSVDAA